ncbi:hypothetical protein R008_M12446 [Saccharomyces cerevisiae R008]|nr:hypothetical protein R008_M12446 [Saccharomyces cerevisiae R008]
MVRAVTWQGVQDPMARYGSRSCYRCLIFFILILGREKASVTRLLKERRKVSFFFFFLIFFVWGKTDYQ